MKIAAEILVKCGYAKGWFKNITGSITVKPTIMLREYSIGDAEYGVYDPPICNPFADTLEGRRQADAIEDWFEQNPDNWHLWNVFDEMRPYTKDQSMHQWRLDRIKWCLDHMKTLEGGDR